jgi:nucleotide-binding universal stress UspA family protein
LNVNVFQNIVAGFDGSKDSRTALRWSACLSKATGARLRIVHAVGLLEHAGLADHAAAHREAALQIATDAGAKPTDVEWSVVDGDPCSALLQMTMAPEAADLVVVGSRGSSAHGGSVLGSTSLELAERSAVPVVIVPTESGSENRVVV